MNSSPAPTGSSLSIPGTWIERVFDKSRLGILQLDSEWKVLYANNAAMRICGWESWLDKRLEDLFQDDKTREVIRNQMALRQQGFGDEYEIEIVRLNTQKRIPVRVAGMPVMASDGTFAGSIAILRSLELERVTKTFNQLVEDAVESGQILQILAEETRRIIPFDAFAASMYNRDMSHALPLFEWPEGFIPGERRWFPIPPTTLKFVQEATPSQWNLSELYKDTESTELGKMIEEGFYSLLRVSR